MTDTNAIVASATIAAPGEVELSEKKTIMLTIRGFPDLPDEVVRSPLLWCHGFQWNVDFYPHGGAISKEKRGGPFFSVYLTSHNADSIHAKATFHVGQSSSAMKTRNFCRSSRSWGKPSLWTREHVLSECDDDGTLIITVDVQVDVQALKCWKPTGDVKARLTKLYESKAGADVTYNLSGIKIVAHKCILGMQESNLLTLVDDSSPTDSEVTIDGADPALFQTMIRFHYTEELPPDFDDCKDAINLLKLADKYGVVNLKMLIEARIVENSALLSVESCVDLLLLSESHNCALLREASMNVLVENMQHIISSGGLAELAQSPSLMQEVVIFQANLGRNDEKAHLLGSLGVSALRKLAHERGLEVDGSRQVLVKRLKTAEDDSVVPLEGSALV